MIRVLDVNKDANGSIVDYFCETDNCSGEVSKVYGRFVFKFLAVDSKVGEGRPMRYYSEEQLLGFIRNGIVCNATVGTAYWNMFRKINLYLCLAVSTDDSTVLLRFNKSLPNQAVLIHGLTKAEVEDIEVVKRECQNWDYVTVKRGRLSSGEKRFVVTANDGRTFEPSEAMKRVIHNFLVYNCGVLYHYKRFIRRDVFEAYHYKGANIAVAIHDKRKPQTYTLYIYDRYYNPAESLVFQEFRDKLFTVSVNREDFMNGRMFNFIGSASQLLSVQDLLGQVWWARSKFSDTDLANLDTIMLYNTVVIWEMYTGC